MAKSKKLSQLENELSALGYGLKHQYVILGGHGYIVETCRTLDDVDKFIGREESRQLGNAGGDCE